MAQQVLVIYTAASGVENSAQVLRMKLL